MHLLCKKISDRYELATFFSISHHRIVLEHELRFKSPILIHYSANIQRKLHTSWHHSTNICHKPAENLQIHLKFFRTYSN